jgi:hypothetical protein
MAGNPFEERLTRLEEQFRALQALTQRLAAWELGTTRTPDMEKGKDNDKEPVEGGTDGASLNEQPGSSARV